ncbi:MAG: hypothetical protein ACK5B9_07625 [Flavobacteriia bacterium]
MENNSNHNLKFYLYRSDGFGQNELIDSILIPKKSQVVIYEGGGIGTVDEYSFCGSYIDSIASNFVDTDTLILKKDPNLLANWKYIEINKSKNGGGECECRLYVSDSDIE